MKSKVTAEEMSAAIAIPMESCLRKDGITRAFLVKKLKAELSATEVKAFNSQGAIIYSKPLTAWDIRQRARMDAQRLLNLYPPDKMQLDVGEIIINYHKPAGQQEINKKRG